MAIIVSKDEGKFSLVVYLHRYVKGKAEIPKRVPPWSCYTRRLPFCKLMLLKFMFLASLLGLGVTE